MKKNKMRGCVLALACLLTGLASPAIAQNPVPFVNQPLVPSSAAPGGPAFTLAVNGTGFSPRATVRWNKTALETRFVSGSRLTAAVPAADIAGVGTASVTVVNPGIGAASNVVYFPVTQPRQIVAFAYPANPPNIGLPPANMPFTLAAGDFNGDGKADIALAEPQLNGGSLVVLLGNGDGTFTILPPTPAPRPNQGGMSVGDFNGDGKLDLAMADAQGNTVTVLLSNGDGTFTPGAPSPVGSGPGVVVPGDFNGDGNLDLAVLGFKDGTLSILLGNGDGTFRAASGSPVPVGAGPLAIAVGDFNGDDKLDLAVTAGNDAYHVILLLGNGDGTFVPAPGSPVAVPNSGRSPGALAAADFNGDGKLDLAVASGVDDTVAVLLGNGDGTFATVPQCCGTSEFANDVNGSLGVGDLRGTGKLDFALAPESGGSYGAANYVTTMYGNGDGTFASGDFSITQDAQQINMAVADFNGDGQLDIAMTDPTYAEVTILLQAPPPGNGPDFSIVAPYGTSISVQAGQMASYPVRVESLNGFTGTVTYSCSGLPANTTCSFSTYNSTNIPESSDFYFDTLWSLFRLNVQTTAPTLTSGGVVWPQGRWPLGLPTSLFGMAFLAALMSSRRRSPRICCLAAGPLATLLMYVMLWTSCGGATAPPPPVPSGGTPPGTYTLTLTATSGSLTHPTTVTLTVQ